METRRRGPITGAEIQREKNDRRERSAALDARPLPKRLQGRPEFDPAAKSAPRASRAAAESGTDPSAYSLAIKLKYDLIHRLESVEAGSADLIKETAAQWDLVKRALKDPDTDSEAAIEIVTRALKDAERRRDAVKDRHAEQETRDLKQILSELERRGAA